MTVLVSKVSPGLEMSGIEILFLSHIGRSSAMPPMLADPRRVQASENIWGPILVRHIFFRTEWLSHCSSSRARIRVQRQVRALQLITPALGTDGDGEDFIPPDAAVRSLMPQLADYIRRDWR
jgi:hypothetical protein